MLEHAAEPLSTDDLLAALWRVIELGPDAQRRLVVQTLVQAAGVLVFETRRGDIIEVPQPEDDEPVEALTPDRA
ncbi:MAG: hypothetical protein AAGJ46_12820, partial [Planctomycetota bacterium]